jgi:hypothetical protein
VLRDYPESHRTLQQVAYYSPPVKGYLAASPDNLVWGKATAGVRKHLRSFPEQTIFPGATIVLLALLGAVLGPWPLRVRVGLAAAVLAAGIFALGLSVLDGRLTYRLLYHYAPGWNGVRTPGRITTLTSLWLALLAGGGAQWVLHRVGRAGKGGLVPGFALVALGAAILVEGSGLGLRQPRVPAPPQGQLGLPSPQLHLPIETRRQYAYMLWSTEGFPRIVNGTSGFKPRFLTRLEHQVRGFPDGRSVRRLRALGVSTVILHPGDASRSPWHDWRRRPVRSLGISRRERGGVVLYDLGRR